MAGLKAGDQIIAMANYQFQTAKDLTALVKSTYPGTQVEIVFVRGNQAYRTFPVLDDFNRPPSEDPALASGEEWSTGAKVALGIGGLVVLTCLFTSACSSSNTSTGAGTDREAERLAEEKRRADQRRYTDHLMSKQIHRDNERRQYERERQQAEEADRQAQ